MEMRGVYGLHPIYQTSDLGYDASLMRGNYAAGLIATSLRKEAKANTRNFRQLKLILALPLELMFEIFIHLHPFDFYNLIRTSKSFRNVLLDSKSSPVWSVVFKRHPEIPQCPPSLSFPKWVSILFGPARCDNCGHPAAMVNFTFLDHICEACTETHRIQPWFFNVPKGIDGNEFGRLIRMSSYAGGMRPARDRYSHSYCSRDEVEGIRAQVEQFMTLIAENVPDAAQNYEAFKAERAAFVRESTRHVETCNSWCFNACAEVKRQYRGLVDRWQTRLIAIGHHPKDTETIRGRGHILSILCHLRIAKFTNTKFKRSLAEMQVFLASAKDQRLFREREKRAKPYIDEVLAFYATYRSSVGVISDYIYSEVKDKQFPVEAAKEHIRLYINKCEAYGRNQLVQIMQKLDNSLEPAIYSIEDPLALAGAVFECPVHTFRYANYYSALFGWDDALKHLDCIIPYSTNSRAEDIDSNCSFAFSTIVYDIIQHLLAQPGLDPFATLLDGTEILNLRFLCVVPGCCNKKGPSPMTLKACVIHAIRRHTKNGDLSRRSYCSPRPFQFGLLSNDATKSVLLHEAKTGRHRFRLDPCKIFRCLHCVDLRKDRLWVLQELKPHLRSKHCVHYPMKSVDYVASALLKDESLPFPTYT